MRRAHCLLLLVFVMATPLVAANERHATNEPNTLRLAEEAFASKDYARALELYRDALEEFPEHKGALFFNMGLCATRLGRDGEALWLFRRALLRLPRSSTVRDALLAVETRVGIDPREPTLGELIFSPVSKITANELLSIVIAVECLLVACWLFLRRGALRLRLCVALLCIALYLIVALVQRHVLAPPQEGVVIASEINLRSQPTTEAAVSGHLRAGEVVRIHETSGGFVRVTHPTGTGWAREERVGRVD